MKDLTALIAEGRQKKRVCNLFVMNCGTTNTMLDKVQEYATLLNAKTIYAFDEKKVEKVKDINKYAWGGPHFYDWSIISKYMQDNMIGSDSFIFVP